MRLSVLLPTINKPTLLRTLQSLSNQAWIPGDEILVISDDNHRDVMCLVANMKSSTLPLRHVQIDDGPHKDWGHTPRNRCTRLAQGNYLMHIDDDDVVVDNGIEQIRSKLTKIPTVHMFRMFDDKKQKKIWTKEGQLKRRHISTQNIVHPNNIRTFGEWGLWYGGDSQFIIQTCAKVNNIQWHDIVTVIYNPQMNVSKQQ